MAEVMIFAVKWYRHVRPRTLLNLVNYYYFFFCLQFQRSSIHSFHFFNRRWIRIYDDGGFLFIPRIFFSKFLFSLP